MANFFYTDSTGTKQGPVSQDKLKHLAAQGIITPQSDLETESGQCGKAGQIAGLFPPPEPPTFGNPVPPQQHQQQGSDKIFCTNCGNEVNKQAVACPKCGVPPQKEKNFCHNCGVSVNPNQIICTKCGSKIVSRGGGIDLEKFGVGGTSQKSRLAYILLGLLPVFCCGLGGIHNLYAGRTNIGLIQLIALVVNAILGAVLVPLTLSLWLIIAIPVALGILIWQIVEICTVTADGNGQQFT